jgi:hypothetical protein
MMFVVIICRCLVAMSHCVPSFSVMPVAGRRRIIVVLVVVTIVVCGQSRMEGVAKRLVGGGKGRVLLCLFGNRSEICKQIMYAKQPDSIAFRSCEFHRTFWSQFRNQVIPLE